MTGSDLIVLLPWLAFGAVLTVVVLLLLRESRCPAIAARPAPGSPDETAGAATGPARQPTEDDHPGTQS